ncbi:HPr family phosphocarrier protein [Aliikangiella sp. G2MR2-5]|uniref:HPr family phosphocarrier protein n=1 Tax=Aliikangiella sp. G2MR2-5 TaxID=2788943 RepID=UPI0018A94057|nr:HPr family phosphocarrier protein [Aliikangiella sp. G2MR2-5]
MPTITCQVVNLKGMHARAAAQIVKLVCGYHSQVTLRHKDKEAPADSLIKLLTLNAPQGSTITIEARGNDSEQVLEALNELFAIGFGE